MFLVFQLAPVTVLGSWGLESPWRLFKVPLEPKEFDMQDEETQEAAVGLLYGFEL